MDVERTTQFLHERIPVTRAMGFTVAALGDAQVTIAAPLAPNVNPHETLFGGTLSTLGLVSCWTLLHVALEEAGIRTTLVGHRSETHFLAPGTSDCQAEARCDPDDLSDFLHTARHGRRASISLSSVVRCGDVDVAKHTGQFVALERVKKDR